MKKLISILVVVFYSLSATSQTAATLSETLDWIKSKIELYPSCGTLCYTANVKYDLNLKVITIVYKSNWNNQVIYTIPLEDINPSGYSFTKDYIFTIRTNSNSMTWINIDSQGKSETKKVSEIYLVFDGPQFRANDLESRLIKAFNTAATLSGANNMKEVF